MPGTKSCSATQSWYASAVAAVSQPQLRPMTSWTMSIRGFEVCSAMMFWAKIAPCSAAVHAPSDWRIGTTSLSTVLGRPTTVSS